MIIMQPERSPGSSPEAARETRGFTMAELLVVVALIVILATGIGVAFRGGESSSSLTAGQTTLGALFTAAQVQATTSGRDVFILVDTEPTSRGFLRQFITVRHTPDITGAIKYNIVGTPTMLPSGVYVSPDTASMDISSSKVVWYNSSGGTTGSSEIIRKTKGAEPLVINGSIGFAPAGELAAHAKYPNGDRKKWYGWRITPNGRIDASSANNQIVLVLGTVSPKDNALAIREDEAYQSRGIKVSYYGQVTMVNYYELFDEN